MRMSSIAMLLALVSAGCGRREPRLVLAQTPKASLSSAIAEARQRAPEVQPQRIWADDETDGSGAPSRDGTLLSYTDWVKGALGIRDLRTGQNRLLTTPTGFDGGFPETSAFSTDGKRLAYRWVDMSAHELRIVDVAGSQPRTIVGKSPDINTIVPIQWTSDDHEILVGIVRADRTAQLAYANVATGALRAIQTIPWGNYGAGSAVLSPDGRHLAMSVPAGKGVDESDLVILTRAESRAVSRIERPGMERVVGWAADGRLFFQSTPRPSNAGSASSLFAVEMRDGKAVGTPEVVKSDMSRVLYPRLTDDGRLFYENITGSLDVYVASVDIANARALSPAARFTHRLVGFNQGIDWTRDGRQAAYLVREGAAPRSPGVVAIRDEQSGDVREIRPELRYINAAIRWSPDGSSILVQATDMKDRHGVYAIDARTGRLTPIAYGNPKGAVMHRPQWAPDGKSVYYVTLDPDYPAPRVVHRQVASGEERVVYSAPQLRSQFALSDDGETLAVIEPTAGGNVINLVPAAGGQSRELLRLPDRVSSVTFSRDGKHVLFAKSQTAGGESQIWRVPVQGGEASPLGLSLVNITGVRVHPDGRRIGYTGGTTQSELWVMDLRNSTKVKADSTR